VITREDLTTHWQEIKNRLRQNWRELSESELSRFSGPSSQLIGAIQQKTGASWNEIESFLNKVIGDAWAAASQTANTAQRYGKEATQTASHGYDQVAALTADCSRKIVDTVKRRPVESLAIAFGVGIAAGAIFLISRRRN
jgi:ElaB/YqjD/DUF883 family membrane-anchored ribosome-binding protein